MNRNHFYNPYMPATSSFTRNFSNRNGNNIDVLQDLIISYNNNIRMHNQIFDNYNKNIQSILTILQFYYSYNNENVNTNFTRRNNVNNTSRRNYNNIDLSTLLYILNIPINSNSNDDAYVPLTSEQILNSTQLLLYNSNLQENTCPISLENFMEGEEICKIRGCGHYFKKNHILRWFNNNHLCPVCRYDVKSYQPNNQNQSQPVNTNISESLNTENENENENENEYSSENNANLRNNSNLTRMISELIFEQIPTIDMSNNLLYTLEIPYPYNPSRN